MRRSRVYNFWSYLLFIYIHICRIRVCKLKFSSDNDGVDVWCGATDPCHEMALGTGIPEYLFYALRLTWSLELYHINSVAMELGCGKLGMFCPLAGFSVTFGPSISFSEG